MEDINTEEDSSLKIEELKIDFDCDVTLSPNIEKLGAAICKVEITEPELEALIYKDPQSPALKSLISTPELSSDVKIEFSPLRDTSQGRKREESLIDLSENNTYDTYDTERSPASAEKDDNCVNENSLSNQSSYSLIVRDDTDDYDAGNYSQDECNQDVDDIVSSASQSPSLAVNKQREINDVRNKDSVNERRCSKRKQRPMEKFSPIKKRRSENVSHPVQVENSEEKNVTSADREHNSETHSGNYYYFLSKSIFTKMFTSVDLVTS